MAVAEAQAAPVEAVCRLFLRLLGLCYLAAFLSLAVQVEGLLGSQGILPAGELLQMVRAQTEGRSVLERAQVLPTVFWLDASDRTLVFVCLLGAAGGLAAVFGLRAAALQALLWVLYLSLVTVGQDFLGFQWDNLLLEAGLLAVALAPPWPARGAERVALWLQRFLCFRLMFASGLVKLLSGDSTWRGLTALRYHYETQPLPTWIGYFAHQLPGQLQSTSTAAAVALELLLPFALLGPARARRWAAAGFLLLQVLIALTGNFAFFNLLSAALAVALLDDDALAPRLRAWLVPAPPPLAPATWRRFVAWPLLTLHTVVALVHFTSGIGLGRPPRPLLALARLFVPLRSASSYGLFAVMTTTRPEIVVEGSRDGLAWEAYEFGDKPGDLRRRPRFVAPHQPRLDWQMWFAALGACEDSPWMYPFLRRLQEGSPAVTALLAHNPFPDEPPRFLRTTLYDYRFSTLDVLRREGRWWTRRELGPFCAPLATAGSDE